MNFEQAVKAISSGNVRVEDVTLLELYGLYKQATIGNINIPRPGMFNLRGQAKWDAWKHFEGLLSEEAKRRYILIVSKYSRF